MKKLKYLLLLLILVILTACQKQALSESDIAFHDYFYNNYQSEDFDADNIIFSFAAMSDIHIGGEGQEEKLDKALGLLMKKPKNAFDALLIAGDLTDTTGRDDFDDQIIILRNILKKHLKKKVSLVYCLGINHDHLHEDISKDVLRYRNVLGKDFHKNEISEEEFFDKGQRHYLINDFHILTLDYDENTYSKEKQEWLINTLEDLTTKEPNKPIFVSYHVPIKDSPYKIIEKYPQVILFSGHSHIPLNNDKAITQTSFTHLHCGGMFYYRQYAYDGQDIQNMGEINDFAQAYIVEVDINNNVRVIRVDLNNDNFYLPEWLIPSPKEDLSHLKYKDLRLEATKPYFNNGTFTFNEEYTYTLQATFEKAENGNNPVEYYMVNFWQLIDEEIVENRKYFSSQFALHNIDEMPEEIEFTFFLKSDHYAISATAFDCYNYSNSIILSKGINVVKVEIDDPRIKVSINKKNTMIEGFLPGDKVTLTIDAPSGYKYELACQDIEIEKNSFDMPDNNVIIRVTLIER